MSGLDADELQLLGDLCRKLGVAAAADAVTDRLQKA
jgi:hypothetical protein